MIYSVHPYIRILYDISRLSILMHVHITPISSSFHMQCVEYITFDTQQYVVTFRERRGFAKKVGVQKRQRSITDT